MRMYSNDWWNSPVDNSNSNADSRDGTNNGVGNNAGAVDSGTYDAGSWQDYTPYDWGDFFA